jgi:hypothetical protein
VKVYADYQKMASHGGGLTLGSLLRFTFGSPAAQAMRARAELLYFSPDYLPNYFDTFHEVFRYQYLPAAYDGSNGLTYQPTKLGYLEAGRGGRRRFGAYLELSHAILDVLTLGVTLRSWKPVGTPAVAGFVAPEFPDYGPSCTSADGKFTCASTIRLAREPGFASLRLFAELPLRQGFQAFASYEAFSVSDESAGLVGFDGDNKVFFSGARIMLLPVLFVQAEARRYFFLQRVNGVSFDPPSLEQDQNYHSNWTMAINLLFGYEF